ncbi:MAG: MoaD/ThiS family protein [Rhodobacteraceae bacterium]|nr:MoaD/ThiS family protein [Paracoccaceae bacterium]
MVRVLYFSWIRERVGVNHEVIDTNAQTVRKLVEELKQRDERYSFAFSDLSSVRVAIDQNMGDFESDITQAKEIALFPPMTGG